MEERVSWVISCLQKKKEILDSKTLWKKGERGASAFAHQIKKNAQLKGEVKEKNVPCPTPL